ncbi:BamA/TamA family outer membrane protein [Roseobacter sp. TSBP12]|uniref:BamA/TamA family outer membrane protein n=1 Tax=Roseobacter sp. TSBP12 TaxID=1236613 RepID=UPI001D0062C6|nr:BamA/TamA family outer membrane protein [Roseobacter sp. TSBP12]
MRRAYLSPRLSFPISQNGVLTLNYRSEWSEVREVDSNYADLPSQIQADIDAGGLVTHSLGYSYSYDTRRTGLNPNAGLLFKFGQDYAGVIGGDVDFTRTSAELTGEMKVLNEEVTLRATVEGGIIESDDGTRVSNRYFNSPSIIRGFETGGIGPRSTTNDLALGGNYYAVARLEADFPLGLPEEYGLTGGVFFDYGSVWGLDDTTAIIAGSDDPNWRSVIGASIFWTTPLGPLRFNFTKALDKEDYDKEQSFDLTISTSF